MGHHHDHNYSSAPYYGAPPSGGAWVGGFGHVAPTTVYNGAPVGYYQPNYAYPDGHPYHHSNFQYNGAPLGAYQAGGNYPMGHPYHHHHHY